VTGARTPEIVETVGSMLGKVPEGWHAPGFGLSAAMRLSVTFDDGTAAFVKGATDGETAAWLRTEHRILAHLHGTGLAPEVLGWQDEGSAHPILVSEDLSAFSWPAAGVENPDGSTSTLWRPGDVDAVHRTLDRLRRVPLPAGLPRTTAWLPPQWPRVVELADRLVDLGVVVPGWLEANAATLVAVDAEADRLPGLDAHLVHGDVRSDNLCVVDDAGERDVRLVDWSHAGAGHERHDLVQLLPTLRLEGGPPPWQVCIEPAALIARLAGPSLQRACVADQPDWLRRVFVELASINLRWVATTLGLSFPVPEGLASR
jgi:hypothetical protein